jgi:hypothetical protein
VEVVAACFKHHISWTDRVDNEEMLQRVKGERNVLHTIKLRKANWVDHTLRRNCCIKHDIKGKTELTRRRGRRCKRLLDGLKKRDSTDN